MDLTEEKKNAILQCEYKEALFIKTIEPLAKSISETLQSFGYDENFIVVISRDYYTAFAKNE